MFAAFDLTADRRDEIRDLLVIWTEAADLMTAGRPLTSPGGDPAGLPVDSGEARGLGASGLTLTFGFGPDLFDLEGRDVYGLSGRRPAALIDLPRFRGDFLEPQRSGGGLFIQAAADDRQVASHAVPNPATIARGAATIRWLQAGFRGTRAFGRPLAGRNLFGFQDGTNNLDVTDARQVATNLWAGPNDEPDWMRGGTFMVVRRIQMRMEHWDSVSLAEQERTFGRRKESGAPFGGSSASDPVDPDDVPSDCHIIQANPRTPGSDAERILRRSYSFADGLDARFGELDVGLFFVCFQRDPRRQFVPIQTRLSRNDHLTEYTFHTGSGIFAIPPGVRDGQYIGQTLFESG